MAKIQDKLLRIGIVQQTPDLGGAETYMLSLMRTFQKAKHEIYFATNLQVFAQETKKLHIQTTHIPFILDIIGNWKGLVKAIMLFPRAVFFYRRLLMEWKHSGVDVLLMSGFSEKMLVTWLSQFYGIPVVWIEYAPLDTIFIRNFTLPQLLYRLLNRIPRWIIIPVKNTALSLIRKGHVHESCLVEIPCGVEQPKSFEKINLPILHGKFVIGNVSRLTQEKGQDVLIKAMPAILKKITNAHLLLVGNGPGRVYFESIVSQLGLQDAVTFTGYVPNVSLYYTVMDVFVFPTVWELEGFGLVSIEAMLHKVPVIASDIGPIPEIIEDGKTGILVTPHDEKAIAKSVERVFSDNLLREELVGNAYTKAMTHYTIKTVSNQLLQKMYEATRA